MGRLFLISLEGNSYKCKHCRAHLALADHIISKSFHCSHGKAYLFDNVVNVTVGEKEDRMMMTGMHTVVDIFCVGCGSIVGWKYEAAHDKNQKYKEGKFILERFKVEGPDGTLYTISPLIESEKARLVRRLWHRNFGELPSPSEMVEIIINRFASKAAYYF